MIVAKDAVVALEIEVWDLWGNLLERSEAPVEYLHGGHDEIFPAVEGALEGKSAGDRVEVRLEPEDAFGDYDEQLVRLEPRSRFPDEIEVGMQFEGVPGDGDAEDDFAGIDAAAGDDDHDDHDDHDADADEGGHIYTVTDVADDTVVLDGNHPFAGMALKFVCTVRGVRPATPAELERGSAEDPTGGVLRVLH